MNLKLTVLLSFVVSIMSSNVQLEELRRQYRDYLQILNKVEKPRSFEMFVENLSRVAYRQCDFFIDKTSDEELTYVDCTDKTSI